MEKNGFYYETKSKYKKDDYLIMRRFKMTQLLQPIVPLSFQVFKAEEFDLIFNVLVVDFAFQFLEDVFNVVLSMLIVKQVMGMTNTGDGSFVGFWTNVNWRGEDASGGWR